MSEGELIDGKVCVACLNDCCVRHSVDAAGDHYVSCDICGRTTRPHDTEYEAEEAFDWCADPHYDGSGTVLLRIRDIIKWVESGVMPLSDLHSYDLRNRINGD